MNLSNVTVIIPAHNRPERLRRLLDYYSRTNIKILVPDSSTNRFSDTGNYPNITYLHQPDMHFLQKINEILPLIRTPYALYCADDDFTVPEAIEEMVRFLDAHPHYHTAQGHYLTFEPHQKEIEFTPRYIRNFDKKIVADTATARLEQYTNYYASILYGVIRTETFKRMYTACFAANGELRFKNLFLAEEYFNLFSLIHGNYATLPIFYSARERIPGSATSTTVPFSVVMNTPEYQQEYAGFIDTLADELAHQDQLPTEQAKETILQTIQMPKTNANISFKRKIIGFVDKHRCTQWLSELLVKRYKQKGLLTVKGMKSYPCTFTTPEREDIIHCIRNQQQRQ